MLDELRQIAIFAKTVDQGSFRAAGKSLRLSPSVVSHHIGQLEQRLGTALLYRSTRKLSLTPDGERLITAAYAMIDAAEAGLQDISNQTQEPSGMLRLTVPAVLAQADLTKQFAQFVLAYPEVRLSIDYSDSLRDLFDDGYDVAIRVGKLQDSSLKAKKLCEIKRTLVAAPTYLKQRVTPNSPDDLCDWDWVELAPVWHVKPVFRKAGESKVVAERKSRISVNNASAITQLALAGAGLALIPEFLTQQDVAAGNLSNVLPDWDVEPLGVYAVWPPNAPKNGVISKFVKLLYNANQKE